MMMIAPPTTPIEKEKVASQKHFEEVLQHRLFEQEQLMKNGFAKQAEQFQSSIKDLQGQVKSKPQSGGGCTIL